MKRALIFLLGLFMFIPSFCLDCQYTEISHELVDESFLVYDENSSIIGSPLNITDIIAGNQWYCGGSTCRNLATLKIHNPYYYDLNVTLNIDILGTCHTGSRTHIFQIKARDYYLVETDGGWGQSPCTIIINEHTLSYHVDYPFNASEQIHQIQRNYFTCKICNGHNCTNDGLSCSINADCGGGYCVEGICNNQFLCYNNDCKCSLDKVQCMDNTRCVVKSSLEVGSKPICRIEECKTNYINQNTGLCAYTSEQLAQIEYEQQSDLNAQNLALIANQSLMIEQQRNATEQLIIQQQEATKQLIYWIIGIFVFFAVVITSLLIFINILNKKNEEEKRKTIEKDILRTEKYIERTNKDLEKSKKELKELESINNKTDKIIQEITNKKEQIKKDKEEIEISEKYIEEQWDSIKPYPNKETGRFVIRNPYLNGYECFYTKDLDLDKYDYKSFVHRWIWKKHNGRWPKPGYHIHHKDGDKYNNKIENLDEIKGEEHYNLHRNN